MKRLRVNVRQRGNHKHCSMPKDGGHDVRLASQRLLLGLAI